MGKFGNGVKGESVDTGERRRFDDTSPYLPPPEAPARQATKPPVVPTWILVLLMIVVIAIAYPLARHLARHWTK